jgi:GNAT superfamily N-acetyltransferase
MSVFEYSISTDQALIDIDLVHRFLSQSYWAKGRPVDVVERAIRNSLSFGVYASGKQLAFARVVTDRATFAYLADVFVLPEYRGLGISKALLQTILAHEDLQTLRMFLLATWDAHGLYEQFGFRTLSHPERMMAITNPDGERAR